MSTYGLMESMRGEFANQLRPFKGGAVGVAEVQRVAQTGPDGTARTWSVSSPPEYIPVHWEALDAEGADALGISLAGVHGRMFYLDGVLASPLGRGDLLITNGEKYQVMVVSQPGNNTPIDSVAAVRRA